MKVNVSGEVLYPGEYLISKDDRLADIIIRAGGFTNNAFLKGAIFTRDKVKEQQISRARELGNLIKKYYATSILTSEEKDLVVSEAKEILDVEKVIASIILVEDLRIQKD